MQDKILKPFLSIVIFMGCQLVITFAILSVYAAAILGTTGAQTESTAETAINAEALSHIPSSMLALALIVSGALTVLICALVIKTIRLKQSFNFHTIKAKHAFLAIAAAGFGIFGTNLLSEQFMLPDLLGEQMKELASNWLGILAIGLVGPVVEEFVFREAVLGQMLRSKMNPWIAMVVSALAFGLIHGNPIQIPFAFIIGMILAVVYSRTGNIFLTSVIHILNNSLSVLQMNMLGERADDFTLTEWVGGTTIAWPGIALTVCICLYLLYRFWKATKTEQ